MGRLHSFRILAKEFKDATGKERRDMMLGGHPASPLINDRAAYAAGMDPRMHNVNSESDDGSKIYKLIESVRSVYDSHKLASQVIFVNEGYNDWKQVQGRRVPTFNLVQSIIDGLVEQGIKRDEIAVVDGSVNPEKRALIADKMNSAELRVVIGQTETLGVGVNMQKNLRAMHHFDAPWMPGDLEQRNGRGDRQGNQWNTVYEYRYITEGLDGRRWQVLAIKDRFIKAFLNSDSTNRVIDGDSVSEESSSDFTESLSEAAGDPRILILNKLKTDVEKLKQRKRTFDIGQKEAEKTLNANKTRLPKMKGQLAGISDAADAYSEKKNAPFTAVIGGKQYKDKKLAETAFLNEVSSGLPKTKDPMGDINNAKEIISDIKGFKVFAWAYNDYGRSVRKVMITRNSKTVSVSETPTLKSVEQRISRLASDARKIEEEINKVEYASKGIETALNQTFPRQKDLDMKEQRLSDIEIDLQSNPYAPPAWLRQGAPRESLVYVKDNSGLSEFVVSGHVWGDEGYYVEIEKDGGYELIQYEDALSESGVRLYDDVGHNRPAGDLVTMTEPGIDLDQQAGEGIGVRASKQGVTKTLITKGITLKQAKLGINQWLRSYNGAAGVNASVVKTQEEAEKILGLNFDGTLHSAYNPKDDSVILISDNISDMAMLRSKLRHEVLIHHGLSLFNDSEFELILTSVARARNSKALKPIWDHVTANYDNQDVVAQVEEVIAHAAEIERSTIQKWFDNVIATLAGALRKIGLMSKSDMTLAEMNKIIETISDRVKLSSIPVGPNPPRGGKKFSRENQPANNTKSFDQVISDLNNANTPAARINALLSVGSLNGSKLLDFVRGKGGLGVVTLRQLSDLASEKLPQVRRYVDTVHSMITRRNQMAFDSAEIAQSARKWIAKNSAEADELFNIAHEATLEGVDPDRDFVYSADAVQGRIDFISGDGEAGLSKQQLGELENLRVELMDSDELRESKHSELQARYDRLSDEAKKHYRAIRDDYESRHIKYSNLLVEQIKKATEDKRIRKQRLAELKSIMELQKVRAPYFPLARFGKFWLESKDESAERRFMMFETEKEQKATAKQLKSAGFNVEIGYNLESSPSIKGASLSFLTDINEKIDGSTLDVTQRREIKDSMYQLYLQALPGRSMRKQFIHRKGVKGWSNDALRAYAENSMASAYQLARMEYSDDLIEQVNDVVRVAKKSDDNQSGRYAEELTKRHQWVMNPTHSTAAQKITSLGFFYMLGVSPAAAMINISQNFVMALPMMAARFGLMKTLSAFSTSMAQTVIGKFSIAESLANADEKSAYQAWHESGLLDATNAHDLAGMAENQNWKYSPGWEKANQVISHLFHKAEVFNRESTAIAAYRLMRDSGMSHEKSIQEAESLTWDAHFDYTNANRARFMQSGTAKVITQFKQYSQNMTYYLTRNLFNALKAEDPTTKSVARKQLLGTFGMTALIGGVSALPLGSIFFIFNALSEMLDDEDEPFDAEIEFKKYLSELFGENADTILYGAGGAGLSPRISLDGLWIRDSNRELEGNDLWTHYAQQVAGPVLGGVVVGAIRGGMDISKGEYYRGIEKIVPKFIRDPMKSYRYSDDGALNTRGDAYKEADDFTLPQLFMQSIGLSDHDLMKQYEINNNVKKYEQNIIKRRGGLIRAYWLAWKQKDGETMDDIRKKITKFNKSNPTVAITARGLRQSIKNRIRHKNESLSGVTVNKNLRYLSEKTSY